jgi:hypothetical protein
MRRFPLLLLESVAVRSDSLDDSRRESSTSYLISPGMRGAFQP